MGGWQIFFAAAGGAVVGGILTSMAIARAWRFWFEHRAFFEDWSPAPTAPATAEMHFDPSPPRLFEPLYNESGDSDHGGSSS